MPSPRCLLALLMFLACTRGDRLAKDRAAHGAAVEDPLAEASWAERDSQLIKVTAATMGNNCGYREGNETEQLSRLCNGRGRCDFAVKEDLVPVQADPKGQRLCQPTYKVEWTCGRSTVKHELMSVMPEQGEARLRLGCGIVEAPPAGVLAHGPTIQATVVGDPTDVHGRVVSHGGLGLAGFRVNLGNRTALTGPEGDFVFDRAPKTYDIRITEREGFHATAYLGLSRRDPVLAFTAPVSRGAFLRHHASVAGVVFSGAEKALGQSRNDGVWFLAPSALGQKASLYPAVADGSHYSPVGITWGGSAQVRGVIVALVGGPGGEPWSSARLAASALLLRDGDAAAVDLRPLPIPSGRIAGRIGQATGQTTADEAQGLRFSYVIPGWIGDIDLGECVVRDGAYDCVLPDLSSLKGEYCLRLGDVWHANSAVRCGGRIGMKDFSIANRASPELTVDEAGRKFSWTRAPGVVQLAVGYSFSRMVHVYTSDGSYPFSALANLGIDLDENDMRVARMGAELYGTEIGNAAVSWLQPYASMDDLASGRGALAMGTSWQMHTTQIDHVRLGVALKWKRNTPPPSFAPLAADGLPPCDQGILAKAASAVPLQRLGETVSMRGILTFDGSWACTLKGCACCNRCNTSWIVTATDGKGPALLLQRAEDPRPLGFGTDQCHIPESPRIDVVASGHLSLYDHTLSLHRRKLFLLDEAAVCVVPPQP